MKYLIIAAFLFPIFCNAQKIDGVGFLRINKTTTKVIDSLKASGYDFKECADFDGCYKPTGLTIVEPRVTPNGKLEGIEVPYYQEHKFYKIGELMISDITIKDIELHFFRDTLYEFLTENYPTEFEEALKLKYGEPTLETETKEVTCINRLTGSYKLAEKSYTRHYRKEKNFEAYTYVSVSYNDKCEKNYFMLFNIVDLKKSAFVDMKEKKIKEDLENKKLELKKGTLKDF
ncbi:MAG TPA: hypothetical protein VIM07_07885 [Chitinophagaceae bacterium]